MRARTAVASRDRGATATRSRLASTGWSGPSGCRAKSAVVTAATSRSSGRRPPPASTAAVWAAISDPPWAASSARSRGPWCRPSTATSTKPASTSSSASSAADSSRVWNGLSGVSRPGENVMPVGRREQQRAAGRQHPSALAQEPPLVPEVLDDLQRHHRVDHAVAHRQRDEVGPRRRHPRVAPPDVPDRLRVVVEREHPRRPAREQVGPVPLAAPRLQHDAPAPRRQRLVDDQVAPEPVVLPRDPGHGPLAGERQLIRRHTHRVGRPSPRPAGKGDSLVTEIATRRRRERRLAVAETGTRRPESADSPSGRKRTTRRGVRGGGGGAGGPGPGRRSPSAPRRS